MHESTLIWALICSILLHGLLVAFVPNFTFDEIKIPDVLEVELANKPEPPPVAEPKPMLPPPEVANPEPKPAPKPVIQSLPMPVVEKIEPTPEQTTPVAPPPEMIAVAPKESAPIQTVPAPAKQAPPLPLMPNQADMEQARNQYVSTLWAAISKQKKYPKLAQMRGLEGEAIVELQLDGNGKLQSKRITQSSGHDMLDKQALDIVEKALPFPMPPEALRNSSFTITVPVPFKLENA